MPALITSTQFRGTLNPTDRISAQLLSPEVDTRWSACYYSNMIRKKHHNLILISAIALLVCSVLFFTQARADCDDIPPGPWLDAEIEAIVEQVSNTVDCCCLKNNLSYTDTLLYPRVVNDCCDGPPPMGHGSCSTSWQGVELLFDPQVISDRMNDRWPNGSLKGFSQPSSWKWGKCQCADGYSEICARQPHGPYYRDTQCTDC